MTLRALALLVLLAALPAGARADVVPPYDCGPVKHWEGGHSGDCEWGPEGPSMLGIGGCCMSLLCFGSVTALIVVFVRRKKNQVQTPSP